MSRWTDEFLNSMSQVADPDADRAVRAVFDAHGVAQINAIMAHLVANDDLIPDGLPPNLRDYLVETEKFPSWVDWKLLERGINLFNVNGPEIVMLLFGASLPVVYADPKIAGVLVLTTDLTKNAFRRVIETAQFVLDMTTPDAFSETGRGIRTIQKVRLMHATIRHLIELDPKWVARWDQALGVPISQLHLIGTLLSFSTTVLQGLEKMNIRVSAGDREAYIHLWKVIGHFLGIQDILLPNDYADSVELMARWSKLFRAKTTAGVQLANALVSLMYSYLDDPVTKGLVINWVRIWIGDETADLLGVPRSNWTRVLIPIERLVFGLLARTEYSSEFLAKIVRGASRKLLEGAVTFERGGNRPEFRIPERLRVTAHMKKAR